MLLDTPVCRRLLCQRKQRGAHFVFLKTSCCGMLVNEAAGVAPASASKRLSRLPLREMKRLRPGSRQQRPRKPSYLKIEAGWSNGSLRQVTMIGSARGGVIAE